ncbi:altronate hydrolase [Niveispirillum sp. SYP-B3756]|uniref:UxaA family hydrolase n=1 Tax=Niveispirillum sp. SYP-B3756 TaxID=2662178 RepID=UPI001290C473|nr:UxaA family hydrolase [Niveispirillum sp. SYP-B3756]MQP68078.1 altronate hydrolase [Niveispirillum sp. SYP-B3756]
MMAPAVILLHGDDNVVVCCRTVEAGDPIQVDGVDIVAAQRVALGHKLARQDLSAGTKVIKYGAAIGSMTAPVKAGDWVHMHNMKSDYISAHLRDAAKG